MKKSLLTISKTSIVFFAALLLVFSNAFGQQQSIEEMVFDDDPNLDQIPKWYYEQQQNSQKAPSTVVTVGNYDNFDLGWDNAETHISMNPNNLDQFFAAWNTDNPYRTQDGHDWNDATSPAWGTTIRGDILTAYDASGNLYYENMYGSPSILGCRIVRSSNNGLTWGSAVTAISGVDKNWLAVDQSTPGANSPYAGYVYTVMTKSGGGNFARSTNLGASWTTTFAPTTQSLPGMMVCVGPNGTTNGGAVYVVTNGGSSTASTYTFYRSLNGGASFSLRSSQNYAGYVGTWIGGRHTVESMRTRPYPFIAADNSNGTYRGRLYLVYATNNPAGNLNKPNVYCRFSTNGGLTWSSAVRVNDDPSSTANHQFQPAIWCDAQTGRLYIHWIDSRDDQVGDNDGYIYGTYSDNGGASFVTNQKISNEPMNINCTTCGGGAPRYQGDYTSIVSHGGVSISSWTDFRDGVFDSYVGYFPDYAMSLTQTSDDPEGAAVILANVPSVKLYTDDVTFTASMQTPGSGSFSISYPTGNVLSSFPGSIPIKVVDNSVPAGNYTLTVVGRGPNGTPVHERQLTINVSGTNIWTGTVSTNWQTAGNWSLGHVPDQGEDVSIPSGTPYSPIIGNGTNAYCYNLTIASGATLSQNETSWFYVHGNFDSDQGTFTQSGVSYLYFDGTSNNTWDDDNEDDTYQHVRVNKDYPNFYTFMWQDMTVEQSFEIREGELKIDNIWTLTINGSASNAFEVESGGKLTLLDESVNVVDGNASFFSGGQAYIIGGSFSCGGDFNIYDNVSYDIQLDGCTLTMHGSGDQNLNIVDAGSYLNDLVIDKSAGSCFITAADLQVKNDVMINSGIFNSNAFDIYLGNDWTNDVGPAAFTESTGRVVFNGPGPDMQYVYGDETFNIIENNTVQAIRINNYTITCASYDWTSGSISVSLGTFIANDLFDGGLFGDWYALTGSEIYLNQDAGQYVDVFSENILIYGGGLIKVTGGADESYWCGGITPLDLEINTGGVLDFDGPGITLWDNAVFTETITDGSIKTSGWFTNFRPDFNPTAGTFEFYGGTDSYINMVAGSSFHNLLINKSGGDKSTYQISDRDGKSSMSAKTNAAIFDSDIVVANNFDITDGTSNTSTFDMYVGGNWSNTVGAAAFVENTNTVFFYGANDGDILTEEWFYNLTVNKTNANFTALEAFENVNVTNLMYIFDGVYEMNAGANLILGNDIIIGAGAGLNANDAALNIYCGGNWTNYNTTYDIYHGFWHGYISTVIFNNAGNNILTTSAPQEDFWNLTVYKAADQFRSNDNIQVFGNLLLFDGEWNDNIGGLTHTFHGDFEVTNNAAWFTHVSPNTVVFTGTGDQDITYDHIGVGYFKDVIVNKVPADNAISSDLDPSGTPANGENDGAKAQMVTMLTDIDIQIGGTLTIEEGTMAVNGNTLRGDGNITINGGTLSLNSNSTLWVDDGAELSVNGGLLETIGTPGNLAHITHRNTGYYAFEVENGGTISAEYTMFEYTNANGVWIKGDGFADPVHTFHNCTFQNGTAGFAPLLVINNDQILTLNGVNFPQTGVSDFNAAKAYNGGEMNMVGATGAFQGETYEFDTYDRVHWTYNAYTLSGNINYYNSGNPINSCTVDLMNGAILVDQATTNASGYYEFSGVADGSYTLLTDCSLPRGGTGLLDVVQTRQFLLGQIPFIPLQQLSADVDANGSAGLLDVVQMRQFLLGTIAGWAQTDWVFLEHAAIVSGGNVIVDYLGLCSGDPDGSHTP